MNIKASLYQKLDICNVYIGANIRKYRKMYALSASSMAKEMNISLRLYHKYEQGITEIPQNILWQISKILKINIDCFFDVMPTSSEIELMRNKEAQILLWSFLNIPQSKTTITLRKLIMEMIKAK